MVDRELVSIITPAYNCARFIQETIDSVLAQTHRNWEMLVVDDGSRDDTVAIVEGIGRDDPRIRVLRQQKNMGPACARNAGLQAANGSLVAFLDSDDLWLPNKLERQIEFMRSRDSAFSFTGFRRMDEKGLSIGALRAVPDRLSYSDLLKNTAIVTSTVVIDRSQTGDFIMPVTYYDDFAAWLSILKKGYVAHGLKDDLLRYRVVGQSISRNKRRSALWVWKTYREVEGLSLPRSIWCFGNYAWRAYRKYRSL